MRGSHGPVHRRLLGTPLSTRKFLYHTIPVRIWNSTVVVLIGGTEEQIRARLRPHNLKASVVDDMVAEIDNRRETAGACCIFSDSAPWYVFIWFPALERTVEFSSGVAHELLHTTFRILNRKGVRYCYDSEEAYTYLLEHLTLEFWRWACKQ